MKPRGKLLSTRWTPTTTKATCYTCKYHDWDANTPASMVCVQTFENLQVNTYYCEQHGAEAKRETGFDGGGFDRTNQIWKEETNGSNRRCTKTSH